METKGPKSLDFVHFAKGVPAAGILHYEISISTFFGNGPAGSKKAVRLRKFASGVLTYCINFQERH